VRVVEESRSARDRELDETLEATFPAAVTDNREASRFELVVDGQTAFLTYERTPQSLVLVHTEVPPSLRGRHLADALAKAAIDAAHAEGVPFVAVCPFVKAYLRKHSHHDTTSEKNVR
jgi:predicted GNAT family acetyltransferase